MIFYRGNSSFTCYDPIIVKNGIHPQCLSMSPKSFIYRVSSVLRRAIKEFGPRHLVDEEEDTCWNSDQVQYFHSRFSLLFLFSHMTSRWSFCVFFPTTCSTSIRLKVYEHKTSVFIRYFDLNFNWWLYLHAYTCMCAHGLFIIMLRHFPLLRDPHNG